METQSTTTTLAKHLVNAMLPLGNIVSNLDLFKSYLYRLGWQVDSLPAEYTSLSDDIADLKARLEAVLDDPNAMTSAALLNSIVAFVDAVKSIDSVPDGIASADRAEFLDSFKRIFLDLFLTDYVLAEFPEVYNLSKLLGILDVSIEPASGSRVAFQKTTLNAGRIPAIIKDPLELPKFVYGWNTLDFKFNLMIQHLDELLSSIGITAYIEQDDGRTLRSIDPTISSLAPYKLALPIILGYIDDLPIELQLEIIKWPSRNGNPPGIALLLSVPTEVVKSHQFSEDLSLALATQSDQDIAVGFVIEGGSLEVVSSPGSSSSPLQDLTASFEYKPVEPALIVGSDDGSRLEFEGGSLAFSVVRVQAGTELRLRYDLQNLRYRLNLEEGDGFISQLAGGRPLQGSLSLLLEWSSVHGINFGADGLVELIIPSHIDLGFVKLESFSLRIIPDGNTLAASIQTNLRTSPGPLDVLVQGIGLQSTFAFQDDYSGNLGPLDLDIGFRPPTGIGLAVDGGGFKGGGFLRFEPEHERYAGVLELEYEERIELKAIGLLTTRLPGGEPGFSLLILITSEFTPIQLGLGFTLNGVGGLLGLNRTARVERLRTGLRDNTLRSILFPENIIANADRILSDLRQVFPPQDGRFLFGPMARIGWGSPTLITADIGLLIEVPQPVRIFILGVARALLPDEEAKLLQLQVNFLGEIDFERELFSFDASLFDSKLLSYTLSGDMAVRLKWGDSDPNFLLTVGGFHPAYDPPPLGLPVLRRLTVQLLSGSNPRLTLEIYFAVTSNTAQVGARLELYAAAGKFNVYGFLSFDALFQFNPFYFIAEVAAMLALRVGSKSIAGIKLELTLEGTTPWKARGTATLKLCWFIKIKVRFNKTFGEERDTRLDDVAVLPLLQAALSDSGTWTASLPSGRHQLVSVKEIDAAGDQIIAQPFGVLEISQRVVPLGVEVQKFGNQRPADGNRFSIEQVRIGEPGDAETPGTSGVQEQFAPAQFFEMTDTEKLSSKSFERYEAGVRVTDSERLEAAYAAKREVDYEIFYIDSQREQRLRSRGRLAPDAVAFNAWASRGAAAASPLSFAGTAKSALAPEAVQVSQEPFAVVNVHDLTLVNGADVASSEAGALNVMRELIRNRPALAEEIQVVPTFEVNRS